MLAPETAGPGAEVQPVLAVNRHASDALDGDRLMTRSEVAALFGVNPRTVTRWEQAGRISCTRTLGGHRRFRESEVRALLNP